MSSGLGLAKRGKEGMTVRRVKGFGSRTKQNEFGSVRIRFR